MASITLLGVNIGAKDLQNIRLVEGPNPISFAEDVNGSQNI